MTSYDLVVIHKLNLDMITALSYSAGFNCNNKPYVITTGGEIKWKQPVRIRHLTTRLFLKISENNEVELQKTIQILGSSLSYILLGRYA